MKWIIYSKCDKLLEVDTHTQINMNAHVIISQDNYLKSLVQYQARINQLILLITNK